MENVKILGAGPAGLSAAINLSRNGYNVDVFEKNQDVGSSIKRNIQGLENWSDEQDVIEEFKKMNIKINFVFEPFKDLKITNCRESWDFSCEKPAFYLVNRGKEETSLDHGLKGTSTRQWSEHKIWRNYTIGKCRYSCNWSRSKV